MAATEISTRANAALDDLYRHHVGEVYRYTYAVLGNHADAEDVTQTTFVNALRALERGDSAAAVALLAPDAVILESGGLETVAEYRAHHLASDIEFAKAVPETRSAIQVAVRGDVAWAASTTTSKGTFRGRAVDSSGAELMVLTRTADGWRIAAIHWSSRRRN